MMKSIPVVQLSPALQSLAKHLVFLSAFLSPFRSGAEAMVEEVSARVSDTYDITILTSALRKDLPRQEEWPSSCCNDLQCTPEGTFQCTFQSTPRRTKKRTIIRLGFGYSFDRYLFPFFACFYVLRLKPDCVHAVLESFAGASLILLRWCGVRARTILTLQSTNTSLLLRLIHSAPDILTAISSTLIWRAKKHGRTDVHLIPNGVDLAPMRHATSMHSKIPHSLLFVGRLESMKGVDILLSALDILHREYPSLPWHLTIVGDGSEAHSLRFLADQLHLSHRITWRGKVSGNDLYSLYATHEVFCGLSRSEAFGNVFLEAQAANCAILATSVGGIPDIVEHDRTGLLVPPNDLVMTSHTLFKLLSDDALRSRLMSADRLALSQYDWNVIAMQYEALYQ